MVKRIYIVLIIIFLLLGCSKIPSISVLPLVDSFEQQENRIAAKMDILWVIDNSGSMEDEQEALRENFNSFITNFIKKGYDYRIAVITTDAYLTGEGFVDGVSHSGYNLIDSSNTHIDFTEYEPGHPAYTIGHKDYKQNNIKNIFAINSNVGTEGSGYESGLRSVKAVLGNLTNQEFNFPRSDAHLAVIVVSDEEDQIAGEIINGAPIEVINNSPVSEYDDFLKGLVDPEYGYSFHTIARLKVSNSCPSSATSPSKGVGTRYIKLSELSGGIQASICEDFAESLSDIAQTIIERVVEFPLTDIPEDSNKLKVSVRSLRKTTFTVLPQDMENGWTYKASKNSIMFHGTAIPVQGSEINVLYDLSGL